MVGRSLAVVLVGTPKKRSSAPKKQTVRDGVLRSAVLLGQDAGPQYHTPLASTGVRKDRRDDKMSKRYPLRHQRPQTHPGPYDAQGMDMASGVISDSSAHDRPQSPFLPPQCPLLSGVVHSPPKYCHNAQNLKRNSNKSNTLTPRCLL